jgi:hypothetical protein
MKQTHKKEKKNSLDTHVKVVSTALFSMISFETVIFWFFGLSVCLSQKKSVSKAKQEKCLGLRNALCEVIYVSNALKYT